MVVPEVNGNLAPWNRSIIMEHLLIIPWFELQKLRQFRRRITHYSTVYGREDV
jgi:hypothetical protein